MTYSLEGKGLSLRIHFRVFRYPGRDSRDERSFSRVRNQTSDSQGVDLDSRGVGMFVSFALRAKSVLVESIAPVEKLRNVRPHSVTYQKQASRVIFHVVFDI